MSHILIRIPIWLHWLTCSWFYSLMYSETLTLSPPVCLLVDPITRFVDPSCLFDAASSSDILSRIEVILSFLYSCAAISSFYFAYSSISLMIYLLAFSYCTQRLVTAFNSSLVSFVFSIVTLSFSLSLSVSIIKSPFRFVSWSTSNLRSLSFCCSSSSRRYSA